MGDTHGWDGLGLWSPRSNLHLGFFGLSNNAALCVEITQISQRKPPPDFRKFLTLKHEYTKVQLVEKAKIQ
jgi:hypothetical protein